MQEDLINYYLKSETYNKQEIDNKISAIPKFDIEVIDSLPTSNISESTVYLVKSGEESNNLYTEYIYADGVWEKLGEQKLDISQFATKDELGKVETQFNTALVKIDSEIKILEKENVEEQELIDGLLSELADGKTVKNDNLNIKDTAQAPMKIKFKGTIKQDIKSIENGDKYDSPSMLHPSEVIGVSRDNEVEVKNKNVFKYKITDNVWNNNGSGVTSEVIDDYRKINIPENPVGWYGVFYNNSGIFLEEINKMFNFIKGKKYTYSFYAKADSDRTIYFQFDNANFNYINLTTEWKRYSLTNIATSNQVPTFYCGNSLSTISYYIKDIQVELEEIATNYTEYLNQNYPISLGDMVLYEDETVDKKKWAKYVFTGNETFNKSTNGKGLTYFFKAWEYSRKNLNIFSNYLKKELGLWDLAEYKDVCSLSASSGALNIMMKDITEVADLQAKLKELYEAGKPLYIVYPLPTEEPREIRDINLIEQLEKLEKAMSYRDATNIIATGENINPIVEVQYKKSNSIRIENLEQLIGTDLVIALDTINGEVI